MTPATLQEVIDELNLLQSLESMSPTDEILYDTCCDLLRDGGYVIDRKRETDEMPRCEWTEEGTDRS